MKWFGLLKLGFKKMLNDYIQSKEGLPLIWGVHDCFTLGIGWARPELMSLYKYDSILGAARTLRKMGMQYGWEVFDLHFKRSKFPQPGDLLGFYYKGIGDVGACGIMTDKGPFTVSNLGHHYTNTIPMACWSPQ